VAGIVGGVAGALWRAESSRPPARSLPAYWWREAWPDQRPHSTPGTSWSLAEVARLDDAFRRRFGRALPVSAYGQTATHAQMGLDHRAAVDVALHPASLEGRWLCALLGQCGFPFLAFVAQAEGRSTGPHVHIGAPSPRLGRRTDETAAASWHRPLARASRLK
jgi:hypothetical protein